MSNQSGLYVGQNFYLMFLLKTLVCVTVDEESQPLVPHPNCYPEPEPHTNDAAPTARQETVRNTDFTYNKNK
jgi:hypothetical protein